MARSAKDSLSSFEDDLSLDGSLLGEVDGTTTDDERLVEVRLPVDTQGREPMRCMELCSLPKKLRELSIEDKRSDLPQGRRATGVVPPVTTLSRIANERSAREMAAARLQ